MIKKIAKDCLTYFKNNPFFRKTMLLYVLTGCMIFLLFGIITTLIITRASLTQMNATEQQMLAQSCNTTDLILRDIHSLANYVFTEDSALQQAMTEPYSPAISQAVQSSFSDVTASSTLIDSVYAVNFNHNIVYSTKTSAASCDGFFDADIMQYLAQHPPKSNIFFSRTTELALPAQEPVSMNYITSVYRNAESCAFIINIDQQKFRELVNLTSSQDSYTTAVLDSNGIVISHSDPAYFAKDMSDTPLYQKVLNSDLSSASFRHNGSVVNFVRSNILGYFYISISTANHLLDSFASQVIYMLLFTLLLLLLYFACSIVASLNTYAPYNHLKKDIYKLFNRSDSEAVRGDEIAHISHLLDEVKSNYRSMETIQYQYINTKQNTVLKKLLTGVFSYLQDDLNTCNISFPHDNFAVVVCSVDHMAKMDSDTIYMIKYAVMNMGKEIFDAHAKTYASEINEYDLEFILNFATDDSFIQSAAERLNTSIQEFFEATVSTAYDTALSASPEEIPVLYHNAKHALPYKLVKGHASIIAFQDIKALDSALSSYPEELESAILKSIPAQNEEELTKNVKQFVAALSTSSYNLIILYMNRLLLAIEQFSIRSSMSEIADDLHRNVGSTVAGLETLDELEQFILSTCHNLMLRFSNVKLESKKDIMAKNILQYIDANYKDPNLSIDMIASEINRSANYTRGIFKQSQGISISEYIANKRFDEVCRLLVETNQSAQEIGAILGLNSGSYFYTSFKKHTGYTPDQYRKLHRAATL